MGIFVTDTGFVKPTWQEFLTRTKNLFATIFGLEFDTGDTTPAGQLAGIIAKVLADCADSDQEIYSSLDPYQAKGVSLDRIANLRGAFRYAAAPSQCSVVCYCQGSDEGLVINSGRQVRRVRGGLVFSLRDALTVSRASCRDIYLAAPDLAAGQTISLVTSFGTFTTTVTGSGTLAALGVLAAAINASPSFVEAVAYASTTDVSAQYKSRCLRIWDPSNDFQIISTVNLTAEVVGSAGGFLCTVTGPNSVLVGEIYQIETPEVGWSAAYNLRAALNGRNDETDEELRIRMFIRAGRATEESIRKNILDNISEVTACIVTSNRTMTVDSSGRPPKSFEVTVSGGYGIEQEIAQEIWKSAPAGIQIYADMAQGGVHEVVVDSQGTSQDIYFSRPIIKALHVNVVITRDSETSFPAGGVTAIRSEIMAWATKEFYPGRNVIPQRFYVPIYKVSGVATATVQVGITNAPGDPVTWSSVELTVDARTQVVLTEATLAVSAV